MPTADYELFKCVSCYFYHRTLTVNRNKFSLTNRSESLHSGARISFRSSWISLRLDWISLRLDWMSLRLDWISLRFGWISLRLDWISLRLDWISLRLYCISLRLAWYNTPVAVSSQRWKWWHHSVKKSTIYSLHFTPGLQSAFYGMCPQSASFALTNFRGVVRGLEANIRQGIRQLKSQLWRVIRRRDFLNGSFEQSSIITCFQGAFN